jgi:predicted transcriptional regulator
MARITATERQLYNVLLELTNRTIARYPRFPQRTLAEAAGVSQGFISVVLQGKQRSLATLEQIVRVMLPGIATDDNAELRRALTRVRAVWRNHEPIARERQ